MKKSLLLLSLFLTTPFFAQNASEYHFDYNLVNRMARLWTDYEITVEYDAYEDHLLHPQYVLEEGYIYKKENHRSEKIGFYNNELLVTGEQTYILKNPALGKIAVRKKESKKWVRIKQSKNTVSFIEDTNELPEVVKLWALRAALQREITFIEQQFHSNVQTGNTVSNI